MYIPIIKLEIEGMKHTILTALMEETAAIDRGVQEALEKLCTEENIARIVHDEARRQIEAALKEEVQNFFRWSNAGRAAVREAVHEHLARMYPERDAG
jgi:hypothetical protein